MSSIDISGLSSIYSSYMTETSANAQADKLKSVASKAGNDSTDEELMDACKQFEAYFLEQVFKEMLKTVPTADSGDQPTSNLVDFFKENTVQEIAKQSTESNSLGLAQMLYEQMKRNIEG